MGREMTMAELRAEPHLPKPGDFYVEQETGDLVFVTEVWDFREGNPDYEYYPIRITFENGTEGQYHRAQEWYSKLADFLDEYEPAPNAMNAIAAEVEAAASEVGAEQTRIIQLGQSMRQLGGGNEPGEGPSLALTNQQGVEHAADLKRKVAEVRNELAKAKKTLTVKTERTQLLIRKQTRAMEARVAAETAALQERMKSMTAALEQQMAVMTEMLEQAQETIWTINLYLGKDETIVRLREGKPAPSEQPIALRQRLLYMDEESAINADENGIDFKNLEEFDAWVVQPANLHQVLPETKGVIALKIRRTPKGYNTGHAMTDAQLEALNKHTYFLMRNGENLYRIDTDLEVRDVLFPLEDEFTELFEKREYNRDAGEYQKVKLQPGSDEYMKALKNVGATERHYLRIFLFLQGLLDRTPIFHSRPEDANRRINVFDMMRQDDHVQFIRDAEDKRLLGVTRPPFFDWLTEVNTGIQVGCRVMGFWLSHNPSDRYKYRPISPGSATGPDADAIYTIARTENGGVVRKGKEAFVFLYDRTDEVLNRDYRYNDDPLYRVAKTRASYSIRPEEDDNFLNIDGASVEDMEWYLKSRSNRHAYAKVFPVLKRAIALKREEEAAERPFLDALAGMLMREHQVDEATARAAVVELATWWKFKNHTHRALLADDEKASRMILREYGLRLKRAKERGAFDVASVVAQLQLVSDAGAPRDVGPIIYVGHKAGKEFVVLRAMNDENIFVNEETYSVTWAADTGLVVGVPEMTDDKEWVGIDARRLRWQQLYATPRFDAFLKDARMVAFLTGPEEEAVIARAWEGVEKKYKNKLDEEVTEYDFFRNGIKSRRKRTYRRVAVVRAKSRHIQLWAHTASPIVPDRLLTEDVREPEMRRFDITWARDKTGAVAKVSDDGGRSYTRHFGIEDIQREGTVLWFDQHAFDQFTADSAEKAKADAHAARLRTLHGLLHAQIRTEMEKRRYDALLAEFLMDHGDMELWEDYLAEKQLPAMQSEAFKKYAPFLIEELGRRVHGLTVREVIERGHAAYVRIHNARHEEQKKTTRFMGDPSYYLAKPLVLEDELPLDLVLFVPDDWAEELKLKTPVLHDEDDDEEEEDDVPEGVTYEDMEVVDADDD